MANPKAIEILYNYIVDALHNASKDITVISKTKSH